MSVALNLHHIGYVVPEIAPVAEQYVTRYGYQLASPILHDPTQTAYVQFLQLPGDHTYLELVTPDGPASKLTNAVRRGGKLHHLCYLANRLEDTLPHLEANGMVLISQPTPAVAFAGRRICWLVDEAGLLVELVERRDPTDLCQPVRIGDNT
jgi:methylmalonyl-CoA/ethylmalonyl-CoA epimerase